MGKLFFLRMTGEKYEGEYIRNKRNGWCRYIWKNGDYYEGQVKDRHQNGIGINYDVSGSWKEVKYEDGK